MPQLAITDDTGLLLHYEMVEQDRYDNPSGNEVQVPDNCDLAPGRYCWDGQTWKPVNMQMFGFDGPKATVALSQGMHFLVNFVPAVVSVMKTLDAHPQVTLDPPAADWLAKWESGEIRIPKVLLRWIRRYRRLQGLED